MARPKWFPEPTEDTDPDMVKAMLLCQGDWWRWGQSMCKRPDLCVADKACYFVVQAAKPHPPAASVVVNDNARIEACRSCGAPIWWGKTARKKTNPYDVHGTERTAISHFTTCPDAASWSKKEPEQVVEKIPPIEWHPGYDGYRWAL